MDYEEADKAILRKFQEQQNRKAINMQHTSDLGVPIGDQDRPEVSAQDQPEASDRSKSYLRDLMMDKACHIGTPISEATGQINLYFYKPRTQKVVSDNINRLKAEGYTGSKYYDKDMWSSKITPTENKSATTNSPKSSQELDDGMYRRPSDGKFFKLYHTVHGNNVQVAKELVVTTKANGFRVNVPSDREVEAKFVYRGRQPLSTLDASMRLTLDEAREFGALYGTCVICGRTLTNELSIALGIGPVCGDREFGGEFKFMLSEAKVSAQESKETEQYSDMTEAELRAELIRVKAEMQ